MLRGRGQGDGVGASGGSPGARVAAGNDPLGVISGGRGSFTALSAAPGPPRNPEPSVGSLSASCGTSIDPAGSETGAPAAPLLRVSTLRVLRSCS